MSFVKQFVCVRHMFSEILTLPHWNTPNCSLIEHSSVIFSCTLLEQYGLVVCMYIVFRAPLLYCIFLIRYCDIVLNFIVFFTFFCTFVRLPHSH